MKISGFISPPLLPAQFLSHYVSSLARNDPGIQHHASENLQCFLASAKWHFYREQGYSQTLGAILRQQNDFDNWAPKPPIAFPARAHLVPTDQLAKKACCL